MARLYVLAGAVLLFNTVSTAVAQSPALPIPPRFGSQPFPAFVGTAAIARPISAAWIPDHPFMAKNGQSNVHNDAYMSDTYTFGGPEGLDPHTQSSYLGGVCVSVAFDRAGRILTVCLGKPSTRLFLIDAHSLAPLAFMELPVAVKAGQEVPSGGYFYLDQFDRAVIPTANRQIWVVRVLDGPCGPGLDRQRVYDLSAEIPEDDSIVSALPDFLGRLWFVTAQGLVGVISPLQRVARPFWLHGERIANSFAVDETGGVFIASDHALYRFDSSETGKPQVTWREPYERGVRVKPGQFSQGTGTTPTLIGPNYVAITDNDDPYMHVMVYRRARQSSSPRLVCRHPVFDANRGATENSLIATDHSIIVENNYGYTLPDALETGKDPAGGVTRIDIDETGGRVVWTSAERVPSLVSKLSLATGLIYTYTVERGADGTDGWYFTAIDFETGKTVFKQLTGTGRLYNSHYAGLYLGPDAAAYVGVVGGLISVRDKDDAQN